MPVYIYEENALEKMAQVEGDRWLREQRNNPDPFCSFQAFKAAWLREVGHDSLLMKQTGCFRSDGNVAIYGDGGWHRYFVRYDGGIVFSAHHADYVEEVLWKARTAGFDVDE